MNERTREEPQRPYNRVTEAMSEVATDLNRARALVSSLERQYEMLHMIATQHPITLPPYEALEQ